ncbi:hypothetical protein PspLS_11791 [Pyricularia sp. CBS 133598]|nr:hypothetical protein PspLS_11791 [Pyricularia sp. CBS 133598]
MSEQSLWILLLKEWVVTLDDIKPFSDELFSSTAASTSSSRAISMSTSDSFTSSSSSSSTSAISTGLITSITTSSSSTTTSTQPAPTLCNPGGSQPKFTLLVNSPGSRYDGLYEIQDDQVLCEVMTLGAASSATVFTFNDNCNLVARNGNVANVLNGLNDSPLYFDASNLVLNPSASFDVTAASCNIVNNALVCAVGAVKVFYICDDDPFVNIAERAPATCNVPILQPIVN